MGITGSIRELQDGLRDAGWRIKWIAWQETGRPEYVFNTPLTLATGFGGAALFLGSAYLAASGRAPASVMVWGIAGIALIIAGRLYAARAKQIGWVAVEARCLDREARELRSSGRGAATVWEYRLLCSFSYDGREYKVTPEPSHTLAFSSEDKLNAYLAERITPGGTCALWIDPANPLHAVFDKKQGI
ncbi:MAG TPA: hypothetical protein DCZ92_04330 [Elusimicrobia bacterium]|nr:hypothetical protein [Elusimicrobiota bacterium]